MSTTTVRIIYDDKIVTTFVRETFEYSEYDVAWHEVPALSDEWLDTDARMRLSPELSKRGVPKGMLDRQAHRPRYCGLPYLVKPDSAPVKFLDGPSQWSWEGDGKAGFSMPRDGDKLPGSDGILRIKYEFPDGGQPIWHHNLAPALELLAEQGVQDVPLTLLRRVVNERNRGERHARER